MLRELQRQGYGQLLVRTHAELDLEDGAATRRFFEQERPDVVFLAAAKVGGIVANNALPVDFLMRNLLIEANVFTAAFRAGVRRLVYLGSSCMYPRDCEQPMREEHLLTGPLEKTNQPYAIAKIAGVEMCHAYNRQHGTRYLAVTPAGLYGPGDSYDPAHSHVLPALIRKAHEAHAAGAAEIVLWGSGRPRRELLHSRDLAQALIFLAQLDDGRFDASFDPSRPPLINIGTGEDHSILELAQIVASVVGFQGRYSHDLGKPDGMPRKLLDASRILALGWKPAVGLREGIAEAYRDFLERGLATGAAGRAAA